MLLMGVLYRQISCQVGMEHLFLESEIQIFHAHQVILFSQARTLRFTKLCQVKRRSPAESCT